MGKTSGRKAPLAILRFINLKQGKAHSRGTVGHLGKIKGFFFFFLVGFGLTVNDSKAEPGKRGLTLDQVASQSRSGLVIGYLNNLCSGWRRNKEGLGKSLARK